MDPAWEAPAAADSAESSTSVLSLRPPPGDQIPRALVSSFFRSVITEDAAGLGELFTSDATEAAAGPRGPASAALEPWKARLRHGQYRRLANEIVYQDGDIETYRYEDLELAALGRPARPPDMQRSELLVRVPIRNARAGGDRLFGDEITFVLRRSGSRWRIRQIIEEFQLP